MILLFIRYRSSCWCESFSFCYI